MGVIHRKIRRVGHLRRRVRLPDASPSTYRTKVKMNLPEKVYTAKDLTRARNRGQWVGWLQGGAVVIVGSIVLNLLGWIPAVLAVGAVGYGGYRLFKWISKTPEDNGAS